MGLADLLLGERGARCLCCHKCGGGDSRVFFEGESDDCLGAALGVGDVAVLGGILVVVGGVDERRPDFDSGLDCVQPGATRDLAKRPADGPAGGKNEWGGGAGRQRGELAGLQLG